MINIWLIIDHLNTITDITDEVWSRIFYWVPTTEQTLTYITVNPISENNPTEVEQKNRLEFRIIAWTAWVNFSTLQNISELLEINLVWYREQKVYKVVKANNVNWYDEKNRKIFIRDLIFSYTI